MDANREMIQDRQSKAIFQNIFGSMYNLQPNTSNMSVFDIIGICFRLCRNEIFQTMIYELALKKIFWRQENERLQPLRKRILTPLMHSNPGLSNSNSCSR